jgi:hypothetical protein
MRRSSTGSTRASAQWSLTRERAGAGAITASIDAESGLDAPSAVAFAWRGARQNLRCSGHAEISARRGRVLDLAIEAGRMLRARVGLRVQDRAFHRPRFGVEVGVSRAFGGGGAPAAPGGETEAAAPPD